MFSKKNLRTCKLVFFSQFRHLLFFFFTFLLCCNQKLAATWATQIKGNSALKQYHEDKNKKQIKQCVQSFTCIELIADQMGFYFSLYLPPYCFKQTLHQIWHYFEYFCQNILLNTSLNLYYNHIWHFSLKMCRLCGRWFSVVGSQLIEGCFDQRSFRSKVVSIQTKCQFDQRVNDYKNCSFGSV